MKLNLNIPRKDFIKKYYQTLNGILNLSNRELEILSQFANIRANLPKDMSKEDKDKSTFSTISRKQVAANIDSTVFNLNNYIKMMKDKKILVSTGKRSLVINPRLLIDLDSNQEIVFKLNII